MANVEYLSYLCIVLLNIMPQIRKIFHVEFKEPINGKKHYYFGSKSAIFQHFSPEQIGITYKTLRNIGSIKEKPYENGQCTIWQGELIASQTNKEELYDT